MPRSAPLGAAALSCFAALPRFALPPSPPSPPALARRTVAAKALDVGWSGGEGGRGQATSDVRSLGVIVRHAFRRLFPDGAGDGREGGQRRKAALRALHDLPLSLLPFAESPHPSAAPPLPRQHFCSTYVRPSQRELPRQGPTGPTHRPRGCATVHRSRAPLHR